MTFKVFLEVALKGKIIKHANVVVSSGKPEEKKKRRPN
jgi:hypothetical protein